MIDDAIITIEDTAVVVSSEKYKTYNYALTLDQFLARLAGEGGQRESGILPPAVRWIAADQSALVFERPPLEVKIYYTNQGKMAAKSVDLEQKLEFVLPIPWQVYTVVFRPNFTMGNFFTKGAIEDLDTQLYGIPLPNTAGYANGGFCHPGEYSTELNQLMSGDYTLADVISFCANYLWTSYFNTNAGGPSPGSVPAELLNGAASKDWPGVLKYWSTLNFTDVLDLDWKPTLNLENAIKSGYDYSYGYKPENKTKTNTASTLAYKLKKS